MHYEVYKDKKGKWRWRAVARNGFIVADSGQGYSRRDSIMKALKQFKNLSMYAQVRENE